MGDNLIFNSLKKRIPELRREIQIIPLRDNGRSLLYFHDSMGYMPSNFALDASIEPLLNFISGSYSVEQITKLLNHKLNPNALLGFAQLLDENLAINSANFMYQQGEINKNFENNNVRKPALAGQLYPERAEEFNLFFKDIFKNSEGIVTGKKRHRALYAPHIDLSVGLSQYKEAFTTIRNLKPKRVIVLGTAHYAGYFGDFYENTPFIGSNKIFELPGCKLNPDNEVLKHLLLSAEQNGFTINDRAHRMEHSIELHLLLARHFWQHDFKIVPILVGGFDELFYMPGGELGSKINHFTTELRKWIDDDTFLLISGDLSHVGRKFGDDKPAASMREWVSELDSKFMQYAAQGDVNQLLALITEKYDQTRICGFPPLYLFLNLLQNPKGKIINYHWWDESEQESAVSFGSILY